MLTAVVFVAVWVGIRAVLAKDALDAARAELTEFSARLGDPGSSTEALYDSVQAKTASAAEKVSDPVWWIAERVPVVGDDLTAFREVTQTVDDLVRDGVGPLAVAADGFDLETLKPADGRLDLSPLIDLGPELSQLNSAMTAALTRTEAIDTSQTIGELTSAVQDVETRLGDLQPAVESLSRALPRLDAALGADGARHYLLMFQNNAEERASGGNPASMALLRVADGSIDLVGQASSSDFPRYETEPLTFDDDWSKLFGARASTWVTNITYTPDFPATAQLAQRMWELEFGRKVDGVISFDPVALSYLLEATGPLQLATGEELTHENAVPFLLNEVYRKYPDPALQDAVFASTAETIFDALTSGAGDLGGLLDQLGRSIDEQRLKMWSADEEEQALLADSPVGNMLPPDNSKTTTVGVYNNDDATSKMSFYMDAAIDVAADRCGASPEFRVATTVTNTLRRDAVDDLPPYVRPHRDGVPPGGDRQWVLLYGPVGSELESATIEGEPVVFGDNLWPTLNSVPDATGADIGRPAVSGEMGGRPVAIVSITMAPEESRTVTATFTGTDGPATDIAVSHTPKVRDVPVTVTESPCR